jgi:hypothetical protein
MMAHLQPGPGPIWRTGRRPAAKATRHAQSRARSGAAQAIESEAKRHMRTGSRQVSPPFVNGLLGWVMDDDCRQQAAGTRGGGKSIPVGAACAAGPTGYSACPGATTMQGCWLAASLAQAALATLADRLPRRARYTTLPPKGEVGRSSI